MDRRLRAQRQHARACAVFPLRHRRHRQGRVCRHAEFDFRRLRRSRADGNVYRRSWRAAPDRPGRVAWRKARFLAGTEEGRHWAESKVKALTGGDPISARLIRQDFFTFTPALKLVIAGNHKPRLRGVDEAIRRRFHLVPFDVTIAPAHRDPLLPKSCARNGPASCNGRSTIRHLFLFIGAEPNTDWLAGSGVALDDKGFIRTGDNVQRPLETSLPGVLAVGDVRSGSVKRVAAAVGDGAQVTPPYYYMRFLRKPASRPRRRPGSENLDG
jgi:hypothetical protein